MAKDGWLALPFSLRNKKIWIAGHRGLVGSAMVRRLQSESCEILTSEIDLRRQSDVESWVKKHTPDVGVLAAAKVGGILANQQQPGEFIYDNMMIEANVIEAARINGVQKLLFLGSSCIYPKHADQPITEDALLTGALEPSNEAYALAKIAGVKLCQAYRRQYGCDFISAMPCNLYGPGDKFDEMNSHVIPALMMKALTAKDVLSVWGAGEALREFLYVDDLAEALVLLLKRYSGESPVNIGSGEEIRIADLARLVAKVTGFTGKIVFDSTKPDGTPRKLLDSAHIRENAWKPEVSLYDGLVRTLDWYRSVYVAVPEQRRRVPI